MSVNIDFAGFKPVKHINPGRQARNRPHNGCPEQDATGISNESHRA